MCGQETDCKRYVLVTKRPAGAAAPSQATPVPENKR
jgi:hypothetical protein